MVFIYFFKIKYAKTINKQIFSAIIKSVKITQKTVETRKIIANTEKIEKSRNCHKTHQVPNFISLTACISNHIFVWHFFVLFHVNTNNFILFIFRF